MRGNNCPCLVVVDMQQFFCSRDSPFGRFVAGTAGSGGAWYFEQLESLVVPNISLLLEAHRTRQFPVLFTEFGSRSPDGDDLPLWARRHNEWAFSLLGEHCYPPLSDPSARVIDPLTPREHEIVVEKTTSGPLAGTDIQDRMRRLGIGTVTVVGVATDVCVMGMVRELADSNFDVYVVSDACATPLQSSHEWALSCLGSTFASIATTNEVVDSVQHFRESPSRPHGPDDLWDRE